MKFLTNLNIADFIQIAILMALVWYSWETRQLRKWQRKQAQLTLVGLDMQRVKNHAESHGNPTPYGKGFPIIMREIYELGKFDPKVLYSRLFHQPLSLRQKIIAWFKSKFSRLS